MSQLVNEPDVSERGPTIANNGPVAWTSGPLPEEEGGASTWLPEGRTLSLGAAALFALGASVVTAIYVRRRQEARVDRVAWLMARSRAMSVPQFRPAAPLGGAGGALLMVALLVARAGRARAHQSRLDELTERLAALQAQVDSPLPPGRPNPRDVLLGGAIGIVLSGAIGRLLQRRSPEPPVLD